MIVYDRATGVRFPAEAGTPHHHVGTESRAQQVPFPVDPGRDFFAQENSGCGREGDNSTPVTLLPRYGMPAYFHDPHIPLCRVYTLKTTSCSNLVSCKDVNLGNGGSSM